MTCRIYATKTHFKELWQNIFMKKYVLLILFAFVVVSLRTENGRCTILPLFLVNNVVLR